MTPILKRGSTGPRFFITSPMSPMRSLARLTWLGAGLVVALAGGCYIDHAAVTREELPAEWQASLAVPHASFADLAGVYHNRGETRDRWLANRKGRSEPPTKRTTYFWSPRSSPSPSDPKISRVGETFELSPDGPTKIRVIVRKGPTVLHEEFREGSWDAAERSFVTEHRDGGAGIGGHSAGVAVEWSSTQILKGADGCLYLRGRRQQAGLGFFLFPVSTTHGGWSRWEPVDP